MTKDEFEARIIAMQGTLFRVSATILSRQCDREDAIQSCILRALRKREQLKDERYMQSWTIRILINECYAIARRAKREQARDELPEPDRPPNGDGEVFRILFSLDRTLKLPTVLYYVEGYSVKEIAGMLRIPQGTVKSRMARARKIMRGQLTDGEALV